MTAPEKMVLQPCPTYGWDHPDRVKYPVEPAVEYTRADLVPAAALAVPEVLALVEAADRAIREAVADEMDPWFAQLRKALAALRGEGRG